ncbi:hypothetical protein C8J57DRAFT_1509463 [Mycena rebaudengoi]|nr:hypothetical protein C8J57DRAFT_1509463 [Mycena rebaudengoi]
MNDQTGEPHVAIRTFQDVRLEGWVNFCRTVNAEQEEHWSHVHLFYQAVLLVMIHRAGRFEGITIAGVSYDISCQYRANVRGWIATAAQVHSPVQ